MEKRGRPQQQNTHARLRHKAYLRLPVLLLALCAYLVAGYYIAQGIFRLTGTPPAVFAHLITGLLGFLIFAIVALLLGFCQRRREGSHMGNHPWDLDSVTDAIKEISAGNFSVLLPEDKSGPFHALTQSVNRMARDLGSMEKLRQDFISDVSHEMQSPLTSISGFAELIRGGKATPQEAEHYAGIIASESRRLSKLSENLLRLSTLESDGLELEKTDFRLDKQLEDVLLMLEPQWAKKNLTPELALEKITLRGNADLLSQVWINLLHNAIKFTPEGGSISIALAKEAGDAVCTIRDSGIGIPKAEQIHIFERFYKVDKSRDRALGGNGLGLSLVKKIVELHGGSVTVESEAGDGAAFRVRIGAG